MLDAERLAELVAADFVKTPEFKDGIVKLGDAICEEMVYNLASDFGCRARKELGVTFNDENLEIEFGMTVEGDIRRAIQDALIKYIKEY